MLQKILYLYYAFINWIAEVNQYSFSNLISLLWEINVYLDALE